MPEAVKIAPVGTQPIAVPPRTTLSAPAPSVSTPTPTKVSSTTPPTRKGITTQTTPTPAQRLAEIEAEQFKRKNIELDTGEWVSREDYEKLEPEERTVLKTQGIKALNQALQRKAERKQAQAIRTEQKRFERDNIKVGEDEWISRKDYNKLDSGTQKLVKKLGVSGYNEYAEAENKRIAQEAKEEATRIERDYVKVGVPRFEDYILRKDYDAMDEDSQRLLGKVGVEAYNRMVAQQNDLIELHNKVVRENSILLPSGEYINKKDWAKFTPIMQEQAQTKGLKALDTSNLSGVETFKKYIEWGLIPKGAEYEGIDANGDIQYGAPTVWQLVPFPQRIIKPSYLRKMYDMQIDWDALRTASEKERAEVGTIIANENIQVAKELFKKHNIPEPSVKAKLKAIGTTTMPEVAKVILPGVWALDWNKMSPVERAINIAIDVAVIGTIVAGASGVRLKLSGRLGRISMSDYKSTWRTTGTDAFKTIREKFGRATAKKFEVVANKIGQGISENDIKLLREGARELRLLGPALEKKGLPVGVIEELSKRVEASGVETLKQQSRLYSDWLKRNPRGTKSVSPETIRKLKEITDRQVRVITEEKPHIKTFDIPPEMPKSPPVRVSTALTKFKEKGITHKVGAKSKVKTSTKIKDKTITQLRIKAVTDVAKATKVSTALAIARKVALEIIIKALAKGETDRKAKEEALTAVKQLAKAAPSTKTRQAIAVHAMTITDTALQQALQLAVQPMVQPLAQLATQTMPQEKPQPKQEVAVVLHPLPKSKDDVALVPHLRPEELQKKRITIQLPDGGGKVVLTKKQYEGIVAWKQGFIYKLTYPPYGQKEIINTRKPIAGITYHKGIGSAARSIILKKGTVPEVIRRDMGIMDITITTPKDSRKPTIKFKRDIKQRTRVTPGIRGIR